MLCCAVLFGCGMSWVELACPARGPHAVLCLVVQGTFIQTVIQQRASPLMLTPYTCICCTCQAAESRGWANVPASENDNDFDVATAWKQQFIDAVMLPEDDGTNWIALTLHYVCVTWKVCTGSHHSYSNPLAPRVWMCAWKGDVLDCRSYWFKCLIPGQRT